MGGNDLAGTFSKQHLAGNFQKIFSGNLNNLKNIFGGNILAGTFLEMSHTLQTIDSNKYYSVVISNYSYQEKFD